MTFASRNSSFSREKRIVQQLRHLDACTFLTSIPFIPPVQWKARVAFRSRRRSRKRLTHNISRLLGDKIRLFRLCLVFAVIFLLCSWRFRERERDHRRRSLVNKPLLPSLTVPPPCLASQRREIHWSHRAVLPYVRFSLSGAIL